MTHGMPGLQLVAQVLASSKLEETLVLNLTFSLVLSVFHFGRPIAEKLKGFSGFPSQFVLFLSNIACFELWGEIIRTNT